MHVLLGLDGSTESLIAVESLARLPFRHKPELTLVTALSQRNDAHNSNADEERFEAEQALVSARLQLEPHFETIHTVVKAANPNQLIMETAAQIDCDLIALGSRGHNALYRTVIGSTTEYVTTHAKCSVVIFREAPQSTDGTQAEWRLLLPFDESESARRATQQLCDFDWSPDHALRVAMILDRPKLLPDTAVYDPNKVRASEGSLQALALNDLNCPVKYTVRESVEVGPALRAIGAKDETNLIFVGASGKSALQQFFLGSVSKYLLHHARCSIWITREKQWVQSKGWNDEQASNQLTQT